MKTVVLIGVAWLLALSLPAGAKEKGAPTLTLSRGARVGIVNLLDPEITQYHSSSVIQDSFLKTYTVDWQVAALLADAVKQRVAQLGLEAVSVAPSVGLTRGRQEFFIDGSVSRGLSKACAAELTQMAVANHVDAFIVLAPGLNDSAHATGSRRKDLPEYLRGWGFATRANDPPGAYPAVFNMTQMLLVSGTGGVALLRALEWGGDYAYSWSTYTLPADLKQPPADELDTLKPIFAEIMTRQSNRLFDQIYVVGAPQ